MLGILYPYVLHSADKVNYVHKHSRPAPLPWLWEGGTGEEGLEVYRSKAWSTSVRSRSVERRKGQRKGSLSLSQSIKREILLRLLRGISVICLFKCPTTLLCCLWVSLNIPCWSWLTGAVCCVFGVCQWYMGPCTCSALLLTCPHSGVCDYTLRQGHLHPLIFSCPALPQTLSYLL